MCPFVTCTASDEGHGVGVCTPLTGSCSDPNLADRTACVDGDPATTSDQCTAGVCGGVDLCAFVTCTASDQCHDVGVCAPLTGSCSDPNLADGTACVDCDPATTSDQFTAGVGESGRAHI